MRYPSTHKEETRKKLIGNARAIAKRGGFGTTGIDELMASIGLTGGAFYGHFPSKEALFAELVEHEISNSADMLAVDESSPPDHVAKKLRSYLSSYHALHPETGCVLPALSLVHAPPPILPNRQTRSVIRVASAISGLVVKRFIGHSAVIE